jgi:7,8-dihydroneopterin aldolase/epimerase/oxygenase
VTATVTVELAGLELLARHGVFPHEREAPQRFVFDVWLDVPTLAAETDRLEDAVDYREVAAAVRRVSDGRKYHLLEALASAVADELLAGFPVNRVRVRVRKPDVRLDEPVAWSAVSVERTREPS